MPLLNAEVEKEVSQQLADLREPVRLVVFTQDVECQYCAETRQMVEEVAELSEHLTAQVYDFVADREEANRLGVDKIPAVAVLGDDDYGIRFYGIPSGYEFTSFLAAIKLASAGKAELSEETLEALSELGTPVRMQVFVTPTCPYCPQAVVLAHKMAVASPMVRADMISAQEFPHLAMKYQVMGVPRTVINESTHIEGAVAEPTVLEKIREAIKAGED